MRRKMLFTQEHLEADGFETHAEGEQPRIMLFCNREKEVHQLERLIVDTWEIPVLVVSDLEDGIVEFHRMHPDLVVVDHQDAARLLREFREDRAPESFIPTLVLVSEEDHGHKQDDMLAGAADFLLKPIDPVEALLRMHNLLSLREARLQLQDRSGGVEESLSNRIEALRRQLARMHAREHALTQQNRLQALGTMATGVAHDFNNVLCVVIGFTEELLRQAHHDPQDPQRAALKSILTAAEDGTEIVHRLREFHRPRDGRETKRPVSLNEIVVQSVELTRPRWNQRSAAAAVEFHIEKDLQPVPSISANAAELREMLTNLIFNAVDAMPNGGTIALRTRVEPGKVVLEVKDTGAGMSERTRRKCLEPFFTTKGENGTGMGLSMVHGIVERHGASMELETELGRGTLFRFRFPALPVEEDSKPETGAAKPLKVLVVDDEPIIGEVIGQMLKRDGHTVFLATEPKEALARAMTEPLDLVITDQSMPLMDGNDLAARIKASSPNTRVLLVTGRGPDERASRFIDHALGKPIDLDSLRQGIVEALA